MKTLLTVALAFWVVLLVISIVVEAILPEEKYPQGDN